LQVSYTHPNIDAKISDVYATKKNTWLVKIDKISFLY